eukprot:2927878-Karenia_brevis.AAC.1
MKTFHQHDPVQANLICLLSATIISFSEMKKDSWRISNFLQIPMLISLGTTHRSHILYNIIHILKNYIGMHNG